MAIQDSTTPSQEQLLGAFSAITLMADSLCQAFSNWDGDEAALSYLMLQGIRQIGFISDQCQEKNMQMKSVNEWLMPPIFSKEEA